MNLSQDTNKLRLAQALQVKENRMKFNPLSYFTPLPHQSPLFASEKKNLGIFGGNRSGKTINGAAYLIKKCLENPGFDCWGATWADMLVPVMEKTYWELLPKNKGIEYARWTDQRGFANKLIKFKNGSRIRFKTYDQGRESFQGAKKDIIHLDEEPPEDITNECKARLIDTNGVLLRTMTPLNGICFDEETKLLSKNGWKGIDELNVGDFIYTINQKTLELELKEVDDLYRDFTNKPMYSIKCQGFDALTTFDHRWFVKNKRSQKYEIRTTAGLNTNCAIPRTFPNNYNPESKYEDWYISLIGWIITDGTYRRDRNQVMICQSLSYNERKCKIIEGLIKESGCCYRVNKVKYHRGEPSEGDALHFWIKKDLAKRIIKQFPNKTISGSFISELSKRQQQLLFDAMILGDGSQNKDGYRFIAEKKYFQNIESLMMLCQLLGKRATYSVRQGKYYDVYIQNSKRYKPFTHVCQTKIKQEEYNGRVWCPHTENETVIAMRNGTSYVSMNTYTYDEMVVNDSKDASVDFWYWDSSQNIHIDQSALERIIGSYADKEAEVRKTGHFINLTSGAAYYPFSDDNVIETFDYMDYRPLEISCDFNVDLMCWNIGQEKNAKDFTFDFVELEGQANTDLLCQMLKNKYVTHKGGWIFYGDISGNARRPESARTNWAIIREHFPGAEIYYQDIRNIKDRVDAYNARLKNSRGDLNAFVTKNCKRLIKDLRQVTWEMLINKGKAGKFTHASDGESYKFFWKYPLTGKITGKQF